jgi:hypothetical protein
MNIYHGEKQSSVRNKEMASKSPDFEALRAERNRVVMESHKRLADEFGINLADIRSNYNPAACYCACSSGGPCEHKWDGDGVEFDDGHGWSSTCSRCGCMSISHDMRVLP